MSNKFLKSQGSSKFYPNRSDNWSQSESVLNEQIDVSKAAALYKNTNRGELEYTGTPLKVYSYKKSDITISADSNLKLDGGFVGINGSDLICYESIELNAGPIGYGLPARLVLNFKTNDKLQDGDTITIRGKVITIQTTGSQDDANQLPLGIAWVGDDSLYQQLYYLGQAIFYMSNPAYGSYFYLKDENENPLVQNYQISVNYSSNPSITIVSSVKNTTHDDYEFDFNFSSSYVMAEGELVTGQTCKMRPYQRPHIMKNCFIPSDRIMYSRNYNFSSSNKRELTYTTNTSVEQIVNKLQIMTDPSHNIAYWQRKNVARNAVLRLNEESNGSYFELELAMSGSIGNQYTFEVRDNASFGLTGISSIQPKIEIENDGKAIVLILGVDSSGGRTGVSGFWNLKLAFAQSGLRIEDYLKLGHYKDSQLSISQPMSAMSFSGGSDSEESNLCREVELEFVHSDVVKDHYSSSYDLIGEIDDLGRRRIADSTSGAPLATSGKVSGIFLKVVPAGTPFKSIKYISGIEFRSRTGGLSSNDITVQYVGGATAGSEVVSVVGSAVSIQIEDQVSTRQQIADAINASMNSLVDARVLGVASEAQSVSITPSPVSLEDGKDALTTDSGLFAFVRYNASYDDTSIVTSSRWLTVVHFSDISDPDSHNIVANFSFGATRFVGALSKLKFELMVDSQSPIMNISLGSNLVNARALNARVRIGSMTIATKTKGFAGNGEYTVSLTRNAPNRASTSIELDGNNIIINTSQSYDTQYSDILNAYNNTPSVNSVVDLSTVGSFSETYYDTFSLRPMSLGMDFWHHEGWSGFGYMSMNTKNFLVDNNPAYNTTFYRFPLHLENSVALREFRVKKLS